MFVQASLRLVVTTFVLGLFLSLPAAAQKAEQERLDAVDLGVKHLVDRLDRGQLGGNYYGYVRCNDHALVGLTLLCEGSGYESGQYQDRHEKLLSYIQSNRFAGKDIPHYYLGVWGHGYMLWYVSELAETASPENRQAIDRLALQLIKELSSWQSKNGGWAHHPALEPTDSGYTEFSVITSLSLCSLLRARDRGYYVDPEVISRAFDYLDSTITGTKGAPRYAADEHIGAGNQREGAPRGALVMLPYALDRRTTPAIRRLLAYLQECEDFTGGHASAALGMCHSALLFATIDEYGHFWKLHGESILYRQRDNGSFNPLPPGERTNTERDGDLSDAFHTLTLALPDAPWKWRQKALPQTSYHSTRAIIERTQALVAKGDTYPSLQELANLDLTTKPGSLMRQASSYLRGALKESRREQDSDWLAEILAPYASFQLISKNDKTTEIAAAISPSFLSGFRAEAKVFIEGTDKPLQKTKITAKTTEMAAKTIKLRNRDITSLDDLRFQVEWTWSGRAFVTTHELLRAIDEP